MQVLAIPPNSLKIQHSAKIGFSSITADKLNNIKQLLTDIRGLFAAQDRDMIGCTLAGRQAGNPDLPEVISLEFRELETHQHQRVPMVAFSYGKQNPNKRGPDIQAGWEIALNSKTGNLLPAISYIERRIGRSQESRYPVIQKIVAPNQFQNQPVTDANGRVFLSKALQLLPLVKAKLEGQPTPYQKVYPIDEEFSISIFEVDETKSL